MKLSIVNVSPDMRTPTEKVEIFVTQIRGLEKNNEHIFVDITVQNCEKASKFIWNPLQSSELLTRNSWWPGKLLAKQKI
jgi:hypothetical protein